ncbi:MAG: zinc-binding dehydrogenase [Saprospiraceae bacterium]
MKAIVFETIDTLPSLKDMSISPKADEVEVDIIAAALNHRDIWITKGLYPGLVPDTIMGADGVGYYNGRRVVINPGLAWGENEQFQSPKFRVLGVPDHGTFAEKIYISPKALFDAPSHLTDEEAAALPVAGVTAYRALFSRAKLQKGENVLITGIGGGVALMAAQLAEAAGANVFFTTGSDDKLENALALGFKGGVNYRNENWLENLATLCGHLDVIVDSAAGDNISKLLKLATYGSRIVLYGGALGKMGGINPQPLFWKQMEIMGSTMGSPHDFEQLLAFVNDHQIRTRVDKVYHFDDYGHAFARLSVGEQMGKVVLKL